jgi:hypothetical protein
MVKNIYNKILQLKVDNQLAESAVPIDNKVKNSLYKKSKNSGIPVNILEEVYVRGYNLWNENFKGTREQFAFDRVNSFIAGGFAADLDSDLISEESLHDWFSKSKSKDGKPGWIQIGGKYHGKPCARQPGQTSTPKCRSSREAASMTKDEIKYAVAKKRKEDKNQPNKRNAAKPTRVATYKEENMNEEKDACYHKVKARYKVWPSAYASGALVKCRKKGAKNWGNKTVKEEVLNKKVMTPKQIANHFDVPLEFVKKQLEIGINVEKEHTSDSITAKRIALAHLSEKPDYYKKLKKAGLEEKINYEKHTKDPKKSSSRFDASDELVLNYKKTTPGQNIKENDMKLFLEAKKKTNTPEAPVDKDIVTSAGVSINRMAKQATTGKVPKPSKAKSLNRPKESIPDESVHTKKYGPDWSKMSDAMPPSQKSLAMGQKYEVGPGHNLPTRVKQDLAQRYAENRQKEQNKPKKTMWGKIKGILGLGEEYLEEISVRDAAGNKKTVGNVPIRMADGTIKKLPPGKSGSSGGGGNGAESGLDEAKTPAWQRKEGKDPKGGLNKKGVASYRAQNPGSKLQTAVTTKPSKLKPGSKSWKRRKSFCARMSGVRGPMKKNGKPTRKALALRKWNC